MKTQDVLVLALSSVLGLVFAVVLVHVKVLFRQTPAGEKVLVSVLYSLASFLALVVYILTLQYLNH